MGNLTDMAGLQGGGQGPSAPPADPIASLQSRLLASHAQARAAFDKTGSATTMLDRVRTGLTQLAALGDLVTPEDVVGEAGKLVAHGADPLALAGLLADMPQNGGGQALAGWVNQHATVVAQREAQVAQAHAAAKHALGVSALHVLQAHGVAGVGSGAAPAPPQPTAPTANALAPVGS